MASCAWRKSIHMREWTGFSIQLANRPPGTTMILHAALSADALRKLQGRAYAGYAMR